MRASFIGYHDLQWASWEEAERAGFEPAVEQAPYRFSRPDPDPPKDRSYQKIRDHQAGEVPVGVPSSFGTVSGAHLPPDLARVVDAWDRLPKAIKAAVLALVQAAGLNG